MVLIGTAAILGGRFAVFVGPPLSHIPHCVVGGLGQVIGIVRRPTRASRCWLSGSVGIPVLRKTSAKF
jgi:hypothetical protein